MNESDEDEPAINFFGSTALNNTGNRESYGVIDSAHDSLTLEEQASKE